MKNYLHQQVSYHIEDYEDLASNYEVGFNVWQYLKIINKLKEIDELDYYDVVLEDYEYINFNIKEYNLNIVYSIYMDFESFEDILERLEHIKNCKNITAYRSEYMADEDLEKDWYPEHIHWELLHNCFTL